MTIRAFKAMCTGVNLEPRGAAEELERKFWRSLSTSSAAPLYGSDVPGTLFNEDEGGAWNLNRLDTMLQLLAKNAPGYVYMYDYGSVS